MSSITAPLVPTTPRLGRGPVVAVALVGALAVGTVVGSHLAGTGTVPTTSGPTAASGAVTGVAPGSVRTGAQAEAHAFGPRAVVDDAAEAAAIDARRLSVWAQRSAGTTSLSITGRSPIQLGDYQRQLDTAAAQGGAASLSIGGSAFFTRKMADYVRQLRAAAHPELGAVDTRAVADALSEDVRRHHLTGSPESMSAVAAAEASPEDVRRGHLVR